MICVGSVKFSSITCASTNGRESESADNGVKGVEQLPEKKRRAELSAPIASGEFTVERSGYDDFPLNKLEDQPLLLIFSFYFLGLL